MNIRAARPQSNATNRGSIPCQVHHKSRAGICESAQRSKNAFIPISEDAQEYWQMSKLVQWAL